jgi:hypothetical protein
LPVPLRRLLAQLIQFLHEATVRAVAVMVMKPPFASADQQMNRISIIFRNDAPETRLYEQTLLLSDRRSDRLLRDPECSNAHGLMASDRKNSFPLGRSRRREW